MYPRKATFTILPAKHNLRHVILDAKYSTKHFLKYSRTFRQYLFDDALRNFANIKKDLLNLIQKENIINIIRRNLSCVPENLKNQSAVAVRTWAHQCECVIAQRFRRGQQMFCLYSKLWEEKALKDFLQKMKLQILRRSKELVLSAVGVTIYNWDKNRIPDTEVLSHINELEYMRNLKQKTMICSICKNENSTDDSCDCPNKKNLYETHDNWSVFIEKKNMIVWRRMHPSGCFEYKVYGSYDDVFADDFVNVQIDINYRRQWDTTAVILDVIEKDPHPESNSDIVYWEMLWPRFFSNRDYVFQRKYLVDGDSKTILLVSKGTEHPDRPVISSKFRVKDYQSYMVIRPYTDYNTPGLEFGLTYYDNPGVNVPETVTSWVAYRAMPEFLNRLREAAREYQAYCDTSKCGRFFNLRSTLISESSDEDRRKDDNLSLSTSQTAVSITDKSNNIEIIMTSPSPIIQADVSKHNYWKYLQPTYYFS